MRAVSAIIVMLGHLRAALLPEFGELVDASYLTQAVYFVSGMGHQAVLVFFVLSGYFVGGSVLRQSGGFDVLDYAVARLSRLWVVLLPALILTMVLDAMLLAWWPHVLDLAHIESWRCIPHDGLLQHDWVTLWGNVLFLQTVYVPIFGSNGPLWSLAYEAWYYLLFPLMWQGVVQASGWPHKLMFATLSCVVFGAMTEEMRGLFPAWVMGALVQLVTARWCWLGQRSWGVLTLVLMLVALSFARLGRIPMGLPFAADLLPALAVAVWCLHVKFARELTWPGGGRALIHRLSDMSFSLYLIHMPIIFVSVGALLPSGKLPLDARGWLIYVGLSVAILCGAWLFWWTFERHAPVVRKAVMRQVRGDRTARTG